MRTEGRVAGETMVPARSEQTEAGRINPGTMADRAAHGGFYCTRSVLPATRTATCLNRCSILSIR